MGRQLEYKSFSEAAPLIQDSDKLLFRSSGIIAKTIRVFTQGEHSHAATASWSKDILECVEVREFTGGRITPLALQVEKFPGQIDVFRTNAIGLPEWSSLEWNTALSLINGLRDSQKGYKKLAEIVKQSGKGKYNRYGADHFMRAFAGSDYGYTSIVVSSLSRIPGARFFFTPNFDDDFVGVHLPYCSAAVAIADRMGGGFDQVKNLSDLETTPADLVRSPFNEYLFTLIPDVTP